MVDPFLALRNHIIASVFRKLPSTGTDIISSVESISVVKVKLVTAISGLAVFRYMVLTSLTPHTMPCPSLLIKVSGGNSLFARTTGMLKVGLHTCACKVTHPGNAINKKIMQAIVLTISG
jgi:hypothetical protein